MRNADSIHAFSERRFFSLFIACEPVADENIQADCKCQHKTEESQGRNAQKLWPHVCRTDNTGTDQQCHYP